MSHERPTPTQKTPIRLRGACAPTADPDKVYECVMNAFKGGGNGIVVSREYEEMRVPNLRVVVRAMRDLARLRA
jgi:hypothetical protein